MELSGESEVEKDEGYREDEADEALGEDVQGHDGGEGQAGEEGIGLQPRTKCGGPSTSLRSGRDDAIFGIITGKRDAVECDEEEVDGEGHPEGEEDVWDVEAGV